MDSLSTTLFARDRFTWLAYLMLGYYGYTQAVLGPVMPFLRAELNMNYTVGALHFTAFALGMVIAGSSGDFAAEKLGRYRVFWGGGAGMALGAVLFVFSPLAVMTIGSAFIMGVIGTYALVMIQSTLSDRHGERRAIALTEANVVASFGMGLAPFLVGRLEGSGLDWRFAMAAGILYWFVLFSHYRGEAMPEQPREADAHAGSGRKPLPPIFWAYVLVVFLGVGAEWSVTSWGADFLENSVGMSKSSAATFMSVYFLAFMLGRAGVSRLTHTVAAKRLLLLVFGLAVIGFIPFWLAPVTVVNIGGLFIMGLGVGNVFPLALSAASDVVSPRQSDAASGRVVLASGGAIVLAPQVLGTLADQVGIANAYGVVVVLLVAAIGVTIRANRLAQTSPG